MAGMARMARHITTWTFCICLLAGRGFAAEAFTKAKTRPPHPATVKATAGQHPLEPIIAYAKQGLAFINSEIRDYSCVMVKRERVQGRLLLHEHMIARVRHENKSAGKAGVPFSVFLHFYAPRRVRGRRVAFVANKHDGKLIVRRGGRRVNITLLVKPDSQGAMRNNRYPVTAFGIKNLVRRLIAVAEREVQEGGKAAASEYEVKVIPGAKIDKRSCVCIQVKHKVKRDRYTFHMARIFIDDEIRLPVRFESYDWPKEDAEKPKLLEEYTYTKIRFNRGLNAEHFFLPIPGQTQKNSKKMIDKIGAR